MSLLICTCYVFPMHCNLNNTHTTPHKGWWGAFQCVELMESLNYGRCAMGVTPQDPQELPSEVWLCHLVNGQFADAVPSL